MSTIKEVIMVLYWLPAMIRTMWKFRRGRFFIFRNESNGFLKFLWAANPNDEESEIHGYFLRAMDEIQARRRTGVWESL